MIAQLRGAVSRIDANSVILDVAGVGYRVFVPLGVLSSLPAEGAEALLHTVMAVREDDITLYGFSTLEEHDVFQLLTSVTGVGPKVALSMLSVLEVADLGRAVSTNDARTLTGVPGVGSKLAQRICLELGERMAEMAFGRRLEAMELRGSAQESAALEDVVDALVNLGYGRPDSRKAAERAAATAANRADTPAIIRDALNLLAGGGKR